MVARDQMSSSSSSEVSARRSVERPRATEESDDPLATFFSAPQGTAEKEPGQAEVQGSVDPLAAFFDDRPKFNEKTPRDREPEENEPDLPKKIDLFVQRHKLDTRVRGIMQNMHPSDAMKVIQVMFPDDCRNPSGFVVSQIRKIEYNAGRAGAILGRQGGRSGDGDRDRDRDRDRAKDRGGHSLKERRGHGESRHGKRSGRDARARSRGRQRGTGRSRRISKDSVSESRSGSSGSESRSRSETRERKRRKRR
uniref:Uncharacterized protein n=1 Tax=Noctiluca scintillans TaxID=2966 RepID=A0A7S1ABR9_NOCSC